MKLEYTVINGAGRMEECAEHISKLFAADGYTILKLAVVDPSVKEMWVRVKNTTSKANYKIKNIFGVNVCATLKLRVIDDSNLLRFEVVNSRWDEGYPMAVFPPTIVIGMVTQSKLLKRMFDETLSFFTTQQ